MTHTAHSTELNAGLHGMRDVFALLGRLMMAWLFIPAGIGKLTGFSGAVGYAASMGMPLPEVGIVIALAVEIVAGIMLLVGFHTRWAAVALAVFTFVATFMFHAYWSAPAEQAMMQQLLFNKNIAVVGGLLAFAAFGPGRWSVQAHR